MACKGCLECLLKLLNFLLALAGLAMVGYGIYLLIEYIRYSQDTISPAGNDFTLMQLSRPVLATVSLPTAILDKLPRAWFIYAFIGIGAILFVVSCFGCIGAATRNGCCLTFYSVLVILLILGELGCAAFIFFDKSWEEVFTHDMTGDFHMIYDFLRQHWKIIKWVALGAVILEALLFLLALLVRAANKPPEYDSDDEIINARQTRQPLLTRASPAPSSAGPLDQRAGRNDAWSARMRDKYGLDTSEFTYNPAEPNRHPQNTAQAGEGGGGRCVIM